MMKSFVARWLKEAMSIFVIGCPTEGDISLRLVPEQIEVVPTELILTFAPG